MPGVVLTESSQLAGRTTQDEGYKSETLNFQFTAPGGTVRLRFRDETFDAGMSTDGGWTSARVIVDQVVIRQGSRIILRDAGADLPGKKAFSTGPLFFDEFGNTKQTGEVDEGGWKLHSNRAWVAYDTYLNAGEYELEVQVRYSLLDNNVNDAMTLRTTVTANDNLRDTESGQIVMRQIASMIADATSRPISDADAGLLMEVLAARAHEESTGGEWVTSDDSNCRLYDIWGNGTNLSSNTEQWARHGDEFGMVRAWTALVHGVITSFGYLHD